MKMTIFRRTKRYNGLEGIEVRENKKYTKKFIDEIKFKISKLQDGYDLEKDSFRVPNKY